MSTNEIDFLINNGTTKALCIAVFSDLALSNLKYSNWKFLENTQQLDEVHKEKLLRKILEKKDKGVATYNKMKTIYNSFTHFKDKYDIELMQLKGLSSILRISVEKEKLREEVAALFNQLPNKATKQQNIIFKNGKYITDREEFWRENRELVEKINISADNCKGFLIMFLYMLKKELPIKEFKNWAKRNQYIIEELLLKSMEAINLKDRPTDCNIILYKDIDVEITQEDITEFIKAGG